MESAKVADVEATDEYANDSVNEGATVTSADGTDIKYVIEPKSEESADKGE